MAPVIAQMSPASQGEGQLLKHPLRQHGYDVRVSDFWICIKDTTDHQLLFVAKAGQDEFAVLFGIFVGDGTERIKEYAGGLFIGLRGFGKCALNFCLGHLYTLWQRYYTISRSLELFPRQFACFLCLICRSNAEAALNSTASFLVPDQALKPGKREKRQKTLCRIVLTIAKHRGEQEVVQPAQGERLFEEKSAETL
jgi:hypothetical protein